MTWKEIENKVNTVGLISDGGGFGDRIQHTSFPENFYRNTGRKLYIPCPVDCFINNPYLTISSQFPDVIIDLWFFRLLFKSGEILQFTPRRNYRSLAEKHLVFDDFKLYLNRPRLYVFEDARVSDLAVIHRTGRTVGELDDETVNYIVNKYRHRGHQIAQIGGKSDKFIEGARDFRGLDLIQTANVVSQASVFVGLNSGMYHLASCYNVPKKIILNQLTTAEQVENFMPCAYNCDLDSYVESNYPHNAVWLDFNAEYFNLFDTDIGITRSIKNI